MTDNAVLLVHGLHMHGHIMGWLGRYLKRHGYTPYLFSYNSRQQSLAAHVAALRATLAALPASRISLVGHSLGGVLILRALAESPDPRIRHAVLLGSPLAGCEIGAHLAGYGWGRIVIGPLIRELCQCAPPAVPPGIRVGVIAGDRPLGLGRFVHHFNAPNDGTVAVSETRIPDLADHRVLPVSHMGMIFDTGVARAVTTFLDQGDFGKPAPSLAGASLQADPDNGGGRR